MYDPWQGNITRNTREDNLKHQMLRALQTQTHLAGWWSCRRLDGYCFHESVTMLPVSVKLFRIERRPHLRYVHTASKKNGNTEEFRIVPWQGPHFMPHVVKLKHKVERKTYWCKNIVSPSWPFLPQIQESSKTYTTHIYQCHIPLIPH